MKSQALLTCIVLILHFHLFAQTEGDTTYLKTVTLKGTKPAPFSAGTRTTTFDSLYKEVNASLSLSDYLVNSPVYIKSYGNGMLSTISFRGTGAEHTSVVWNGFSINNPSLGLTDFSIVPVNMHNDIALHHGSLGGAYGNAAIGGAVLLNSKPAWKRELVASARQDVGSFNRKVTTASLRIGNGKIETAGNYYYNNSENNFLYKESGSELWSRQNHAAQKMISGSQNIYVKLNRKSTLSLYSWYNYSDRQVQPGINVASKDLRKDENLRLAFDFTNKSGLGTTVVRGAWFSDYLIFNASGLVSHTDIKTTQGQLEHTFKLGKFIFRPGSEYQLFKADIANYPSLVTETRTSAFIFSEAELFKNIDVSLNIRKAFVPSFDPPVTVNSGMNIYAIKKKGINTKLKISGGTGYRVPTLNERYWPTGDPDLKPEKSINAEVGAETEMLFKSLNIESEITVFSMLVDDWVLWRPSASSSWTPINISQVYSRGLEASVSIRKRFNKLVLYTGLNYSFTKSTVMQSDDPLNIPVGNQLIYVPLNKASLIGSMKYQEFYIQTAMSFTGYRFSEPENIRYIEGYFLLDLSFGKSLIYKKLDFTISGEVNNILNSSYQNFLNYAMPGRSYMVSLIIKYQNAFKNKQ